MTGVGVLAAIAGVLAAVGVVDLLASSAGAKGPAAPTTQGAVRMLAAVGRRFPTRPPSGLARRIDRAGLEASVAEVMALKAGTGVAGLAVALLLGSGVPGRLPWLVLAAGPLVGFLLPDAWLRRRTRLRRRAMEQQLGDVLELLRVAVEAGLTVPRALGEVGRRHPGVLATEIRHAAGLQEWGMPQRQALAVLVSRCPTPGVATLAAALGRAERHGAPLGDALAAQAEEARARRARESIEAAARAAPKIQLIVALLLVPSAMLLMAAAMLPALAWR